MHRRIHPRRAVITNAAKKPRSRGSDGEPRGARALWRGSIAFGLVQIPVHLVVAERTDELSFHQVDRRDSSRIRYKRVNEGTGEEVKWGDIVKAYEMDDGALVVLEDADFEKASVEATGTIDIQDFVARADIPPEYFQRSYFLVPEKSSKRAYAVLREAMEKAERAAVALVVLRTRQHLCAIVPEGSVLRLVILHFEHELVPASSIARELPTASSATAKEEAMAAQLVESLAAKWDPSKYRDTYKEDLLRAIARKAKTGRISAPRAKKAPRPAHADLLALLERSVARTSRTPAKRKAKAKKAA